MLQVFFKRVVAIKSFLQHSHFLRILKNELGFLYRGLHSVQTLPFFREFGETVMLLLQLTQFVSINLPFNVNPFLIRSALLWIAPQDNEQNKLFLYLTR